MAALGWTRRVFSFRYRARLLALVAIGLPAFAMLLAVVVPRLMRALW